MRFPVGPRFGAAGEGPSAAGTSPVHVGAGVLTAEHDLASFECGKPTPNSWLGNPALPFARNEAAFALKRGRAIDLFALGLSNWIRQAGPIRTPRRDVTRPRSSETPDA